MAASVALETRPSLLPSATGQKGPLASTTASRAMSVRMSAQETVLGQAASSLAFTLSTELNPRRLLFGLASLSARLPSVELSRTEASQPYNFVMMRA